MAFEWRDYLELAQFLHQHALTGVLAEAAHRSAYYAAFCHVRNHARDHRGFLPRHDGDDHGRPRAYLRVGKLRGIAGKLDRMRRWRNDCDYRDVVEIPLIETVASALDDAVHVFRSLPRQHDKHEGEPL